MKTSILGTGLSGLVGSRIVELLNDKFEFQDMSYATGVDITNMDQVIKIVGSSSARLILHMAAKTDVDECEDEKILGEDSSAWLVNVVGTQNIIEAAKKFNKRLIYISTDFVFDGQKQTYYEDDEPNPVNWYATTKYEGEKIVSRASISYCIARLSYPYRASFKEKYDFVRKIITKTLSKERIKALTDHVITPTFIDDIAFGLEILFQKELTGIFHLVGTGSLTPYEAVENIYKTFGLQGQIEKVQRQYYFKNRAFRPCRLALNNDKITKLGVYMRNFNEGLQEMKKQMMDSSF